MLFEDQKDRWLRGFTEESYREAVAAAAYGETVFESQEIVAVRYGSIVEIHRQSSGFVLIGSVSSVSTGSVLREVVHSYLRGMDAGCDEAVKRITNTPSHRSEQVVGGE